MPLIKIFKKIPANIIPSADFFKELGKTNDTIPSMEDCKVLEYPWQIFEYNDWAIRQDFELITKEENLVRNFFN